MTEEEKKEFEEFLQWKAEKAKQAEQDKPAEAEELSDNSDEEDNPSSQLVENPPKETKSSNVVEKESSNPVFIVAAAIIGLIILFSLLTCLANRHEKAQSAEQEQELAVVDSDSIEIVDEYVAEPAKAVWDISIEKDEMTDTKNIWASITSDNYILQDFPYEGRTRAIITVRYMKKYGYDVLIQISQGQMNGRDYYSTNYVTARFDDGTPKKYYFNESADGDSKVVFLRNHSEFIKNCKKAKDIKIDLPLYQGGRPVFTFHVDEPLVWPN